MIEKVKSNPLVLIILISIFVFVVGMRIGYWQADKKWGDYYPIGGET